MTRATAHRARKERRCSDCRRTIAVGEVYVRHVASPNDPDVGNEGWWRLNECADCARRCGRGDLIETRAAA
ncbi:hypothetical protein [Amycolatopsis thermoflava]|uniref:hypothetical protein n=1 Tax=Amycolatopsis thermoflava TaxID=84480 RepID=UPI0037FB0536